MRVAAIDIGTNTARLLVADSDGADLVDQVRLARVCGLGKGVDASGRLNEAAITRTLEVLNEYAGHLDGIDQVRIIATSASRDATNRDVFFDAVHDLLGHRPELISGSEEAAFSFTGATTSLGHTGPALVVDIGGGSTELVFGHANPEYAISVDMGSVRLTDRLLPDRPVSTAALAAARRHAAEALTPVQIPGTPVVTIGVAGTFTSLAALTLQLPAYDRDQVDQTALTHTQVSDLVEDLAARSIEATAALPALDPKRAPVILGGAIVAEQVMETLGLVSVTVSEHDLLDGVALSLLPE